MIRDKAINLNMLGNSYNDYVDIHGTYQGQYGLKNKFYLNRNGKQAFYNKLKVDRQTRLAIKFYNWIKYK